MIAVEPKDSPVLSEGHAGSHKLQGIGAGFVPYTLDIAVYDEVIAVENEAAFEYGRLVGKTEGVLAGISSGAALAAAIEVAKTGSINKASESLYIAPPNMAVLFSSIEFISLEFVKSTAPP